MGIAALFAVTWLPQLDAMADSPGRDSAIAFLHATVIDVSASSPEAALLADRTVVVRGRRIVAVAGPGSVEAPAGALIVDASGRYLIPGLWDMHAHTLADRQTREVVFPLDVANGVTGIRDMEGDCVAPAGDCADKAPFEAHSRWRAEVASGSLLGPRTIIGSAFVDAPPVPHPGSMPVANPDEARAAVRYVKRRGIDFLKVYNKLSRESYFALADEARRLGVPFAGHVPALVGAIEASRAGQKSEEHLFGALVACSGRESGLMAERQRLVDEGKPFAAVAALRDEQQRALSYAADCTAFFATLKAQGTFIVPTYNYWRANSPFSYVDEPRRQDDPRLSYMPASLRKRWADWAGPAIASVTPAEIDESREAFRERVGFARRLYRAGVPMLIGTDSDVPFAVPGFNFHDEMATMVEAGIPPLAVLRMATLDPATFLEARDTLGTVAPGKLADLVLLDGNPLANIANTRRIRAVVIDGRLLDRAALDALLAGVRARAAGL